MVLPSTTRSIRISTTLRPDEYKRAKLSGRSYRQLINLGIAQLEQTPKLIEERQQINDRMAVLERNLNFFKREYYAAKQLELKEANNVQN